nr:MAG TPA: hypothetical protein [Bacteriophage sp.]
MCLAFFESVFAGENFQTVFSVGILKPFLSGVFPNCFFYRNFEIVFLRRFFEDVFAAKFQNRFSLTALDCSFSLDYSRGKHRKDA